MKESNQPMRTKARWDYSEAPAGVSNQRGLLLGIKPGFGRAFSWCSDTAQ